MSVRVLAAPIGAAIGFAIGGPAGAAWGWQIGATAGSILDPATIKGPSLGDIAQQTSQEGGPIPIVYGISAPIAGNVIACSEPRIEKVKSGGKGGPKVESEVVYRTYAIGICEGPIGGVLRVWRNNTKVYDALDPEYNEPGPYYDAPGLIGIRIATRNEYFLEKARFFLGDYEQDASPDLEAIYGAGTTPAHRGLAYMVMADEDVTDVGGMVPQWTFQVAGTGKIVERSEMVFVSHSAQNSRFSLIDGEGNTLAGGVTGIDTGSYQGWEQMWELDEPEACYLCGIKCAPGTVSFVKVKVNLDGTLQQIDAETVDVSSAVSTATPQYGGMRTPRNAAVTRFYLGLSGGSNHGLLEIQPFAATPTFNFTAEFRQNAATGCGRAGAYITGIGVFSGGCSGGQVQATCVRSDLGAVWPISSGCMSNPSASALLPPRQQAYSGGEPCAKDDAGVQYLQASSASPGVLCIRADEVTSILPGPGALINHAVERLAVSLPGTGNSTGRFVIENVSGRVLLLQGPIVNAPSRSDTWLMNQLDAPILVNSGNLSGTHRAVALPSGVLYTVSGGSQNQSTTYRKVTYAGVLQSEVTVVNGPNQLGPISPTSTGYPVVFRNGVGVDGVAASAISVEDTIRDICARAGVAPDSIDTAELIDIEARGLTVTNQYPAYQAINALGQVYRFDATKYDGKIRFIPRGGNSVATITEDDMVSEDDAPIDARSKRSDAIAIPRVLNLSYYDVDSSGLTPIKQTSERSGDRRAAGDASMQSAVVMDANTASQAVHIAHAVMIEEQKGELRFALPDNWLKLVPTDPIIVQWQGKVERARLTQVEILDGYQRYIALRDRQSAYTSEVEGLPPPVIPNPNSRVAGPTVIIPLDVPIVQDQDDSVGLSYYVAVCGLTTGWTGATVELSYDGGANYVQSKSAGIPAVIGLLKSSLPSHPVDYPDYTNEFEVELYSPGAELETTDLAGMMNRFNLAAVGNLDDGWELINFSSAVEDDPETRHWTLSGLLRGRRGTAPRSHSADDVIVLMDRGLVAMEAAEVSNIGQTLTFRATSNGETTDTGTVVSIEYEGWSQKERKPAYLEAEKDGDNLVVSFQGVGRLGGGASATHGAYFTDYRVTLTDAASTVQQQNVDTVPFNISAGGLAFPVTLRVEQMNELTGAGEYVEAVVRDDSIPLTEGAVDIVFGGSPTERDAVYVNIQYLRTASSVMKNFSQVIDASDFSPNDSPEDFADALHAELTAFFSGEPVSITMPSPDTVRIAPSVAFLFLVYEPELVRPRGVLDILQEPLPVQAGVKQVVALDLYQSVGGTWIPAPDPSNAYKTGGGGQFNFTIKGLTWGKKGRRPGAEMWPTQDQQYHGEIFTVPNNIWTSPGYSMSDVVTRFSSASLLNMAYFDDVTIAVVGSRNVVQITMKDGWEIPDNYILGVSTDSAFGLSPGSHPSGYRPGIKQVTAGVPAFPSGAKKSVSVRFSNISVTTSSGSVWSSFMPGDDIVVDLDGTPYTHTVSSDEADAFNKLGTLDSADIGFRNDVYESLKTSIEASGDFDVYLDAYANGLYAGLRIERNVVNTDFALSVTSTGFGLTVMKAEV